MIRVRAFSFTRPEIVARNVCTFVRSRAECSLLYEVCERRSDVAGDDSDINELWRDRKLTQS